MLTDFQFFSLSDSAVIV